MTGAGDVSGGEVADVRALTPRQARRMVRWAAVGALGFCLQVGVLTLLATRGGVPYPLATALAVGVAILHNFFWHERWTWGDRRRGPWRERVECLGRFGGVSIAASVAGHVALMVVCVELLHLSLVAASLVSVAALSVVTFRVTDRVVFGRKPGEVGTSSYMTRAGGLVGCGVMLLHASAAAAAELQPVTLQAWAQYVRSTEARIERSLMSSGPFLDVDPARLQGGTIVVEPAGTGGAAAVGVHGGLVHHWRAAVLVRNVSLNQVLEELQSADASRHVQEDVLAWRLLSGGGPASRVYVKMTRKEIVRVTYNTEHDVTFRRHGAARASSRSASTKIAELEHANTPQEREKPVGRDRGFLWRMNSYWRYQQTDHGVVIQLESLTLSRPVPWVVRTLVGPLIDGVARESIVRTLAALDRRLTRVGHGLAGEAETRSPGPPQIGPGRSRSVSEVGVRARVG
jgi:putative flippase GtrA